MVRSDTAISSFYGGEMSYLEHSGRGKGVIVYPGKERAEQYVALPPLLPPRVKEEALATPDVEAASSGAVGMETESAEEAEEEDLSQERILSHIHKLAGHLDRLEALAAIARVRGVKWQ